MKTLALAFCLLLPALPAAAQIMPDDGIARLTVTGEGSAELPPDMATVTMGATTQGATAVEALALNNEMVAQTLEVLKTEGVAPRDIQTSGLNLSPVYVDRPMRDNDGSMPEISGFRASNTVTVRVRALEKLGGILDKVVSAGANEFRGLEFGVSEPQQATDTARRNALADARRKADLYAETADLKIVGILSLNEDTRRPQPVMMRMEAMAARDSSVPIAEGELSLQVDVTITYEIAPAQ